MTRRSRSGGGSPLEAQIAITELARRCPRLRLAPDQRPTFHPNISFRGPQVLKIRTG